MQPSPETSFIKLLPLLGLLAAPVGVVSQGTGTGVGSIEMTTDAGTRVFQVMEGSPSEGHASGFNEQPMGEALAVTASLRGVEEASGDALLVQTGVFRESLEQICDPMTNNVELHPAGDAPRARLRPGGEAPATCPENTVDVEVTDASFDAEAGTLHLVGTFSGPLGTGEDAVQVREGRFEATLRSFRELW